MQDFDESNFKRCIITTFDDGYQNYEFKYPNIWIITGTNNKGKYRLKNKVQPDIEIYSISSWKVKIIDI